VTLAVRLAAGVLVLLAGAAGARREASPSASGAAERGLRLFDVHCARCHGIGGGGGEGPTLQRPVLRRAPDDTALVGIIQNGIPRTAMTGSFALSDAEAADVASYVRDLGRLASEPVAGDAARGRAVYDDNGCEACHIVAGVGRGLGPELTAVGALRGPAYLRQSLLEPGAVVADQHRVLAVTTASGATVRGQRIAEDEFSVVLRDADLRLHSFAAAELDSVRREMGRSLMPSYAQRLDAEEIEHLVAYLAALQGEE
jgi:putative heme-binding domain-containing protein